LNVVFAHARQQPKFLDMNGRERITINPNQCGGRPCVRGMRIRVKDVLDMLAGGAKQEEILADFPDLKAEDIRACIAYAARNRDHAIPGKVATSVKPDLLFRHNQL
jgi:uncharacterized protein (DUF433 family)